MASPVAEKSKKLRRVRGWAIYSCIGCFSSDVVSVDQQVFVGIEEDTGERLESVGFYDLDSRVSFGGGWLSLEDGYPSGSDQSRRSLLGMFG